MNDFKLNREEIKRHFLFWLSITIFILIVDPIKNFFSKELIGTFIIMFSYIFVYYSTYLVIFPKYYISKKIRLILFTILLYIIYLGIRYFYTKVINPESYVNFPQRKLFINTTFLFCIVYMVGFGSYNNKVGILKIKNLTTLEKLKLTNELNFYRNQFNPNITYKFLNFCHIISLKEAREVAIAIELYSEMLNYTFEISNIIKNPIRTGLSGQKCNLELHRGYKLC